MPNVSRSSSGRPAHGPLLVPVAELRRRVGNVDEVEGAVALDGAEVLGTRLADGAEATVALRLEALSDAVVITGEAEAPWEGECRRCLEPVSGMAIGDIDEVARTMPLDGELAIEDDRIDLTEAVRAAVVLVADGTAVQRRLHGPRPGGLPGHGRGRGRGRRSTSTRPPVGGPLGAPPRRVNRAFGPPRCTAGRRDGNVVGWP